MARKTPAELQAAKVAAEKTRAQKARQASDRIDWLLETRTGVTSLQDTARALYEEYGKQAAKWPSMPVTDRQLGRINQVLGKIRESLKTEGEEALAGLEDFVAAGDPPQTRDIVLVLREAMGALATFRGKMTSELEKFSGEYEFDF